MCVQAMPHVRVPVQSQAGMPKVSGARLDRTGQLVCACAEALLKRPRAALSTW